MPLCHLCQKDGKLVKAHIIPEAFFREIRRGEEALLLLASVPGQIQRRSRTGVYDKAIVCTECEATFSQVDSYGASVLLKDFSAHFSAIRVGGKIVGYESATVDAMFLLGFLVSVLWRASVSRHPFYSKVSLGQYEASAKSAHLGGGGNVSKAFDAVLSCWEEEDQEIPLYPILSPFREDWFGVNAYRIYLGRVVAYVKVDRRPFPPKIASMSIRTRGSAFVVARSLSDSHDFHTIKHVLAYSESTRERISKRRRET